MKTFSINGNEVPMVKVRTLGRMLGVTNEAIRKRENIGDIPRTPFVNSRADRLYPLEVLAISEYLYKVIFPRRRFKQPDWFKDLTYKALDIVYKEVLEYGRVRDESVFFGLSNEHEQFIPGLAMNYITHYRMVYLDEEEED